MLSDSAHFCKSIKSFLSDNRGNCVVFWHTEYWEIARESIHKIAQTDPSQYFLQLHELYTTQPRLLMTSEKIFLKTLYEKEKMLVTSISPFPIMFSTLPNTNFIFSLTFILSSANAFNLDKSKNLRFGKEISSLITEQSVSLTLYLICQFWALPVQQQIKIWCHKYWQMGIQVSDWVENIVGKEEIACYEQFLLFPQCFQKLSFFDVWKWVSME